MIFQYWDIFLVHLILAIVLFFVVNWLGRHSKGFGYTEISLFAKDDENPAFNYLFRVLTPLVFLIIISTICDAFNIQRYKSELYLISIYYLVVRLLYVLLNGRIRLINWKKIILYWFSIIPISYFIYDKIIKNQNLLPDFNNISNELWFLIIIFLYQLFNKYEPSSRGFKKRKNKYILSFYNKYENKYRNIIDELIKNNKLKSIVYAIIIYEGFNRPKYARLFESIKLLIKKEATMGIMQIKTKEYINDIKSIKLGIEKIEKYYRTCISLMLNDQLKIIGEKELINRILRFYNGDSYAREVSSIHEIIFLNYYINDESSLITESIKDILAKKNVNIKKDEKKI
jgi:hypothetical protein